MCRLNILKKEARKSIMAFSPRRRVFFPSVKSSFRPPNERARGSERGLLPNVKGAAAVNAAGFQNGMVVGLKLDLFVCGTPGTTLTRAPAPVVLHPPTGHRPQCSDSYHKPPWEFRNGSSGCLKRTTRLRRGPSHHSNSCNAF